MCGLQVAEAQASAEDRITELTADVKALEGRALALKNELDASRTAAATAATTAASAVVATASIMAAPVVGAAPGVPPADSSVAEVCIGGIR